MKKITRICSALFIGCTMLLSVNAFAKGANGTDKKQNGETPTVAGSTTCTTFGLILNQTNEKCYGQSNGTVVIYAIGGTQPYTYSWSPSVGSNFALDTLELAGGMAAGSYTCTITDANGCPYNETVTITQPPLLTASTTATTNDLCNGASTGSASISAAGGTPSYTYAWTPGGNKTASESNMKAGTYIVTVTDSNKCTAKDTVVIKQPVAITTSVTVVSSSCKTSDGSAMVTASAGVVPYTYMWNTGATTDSVSGLSAGTYTVTVTDSNGCSVMVPVSVSDSTTLATSISNQANEKCFGNSIGSVAIKVTGGLGLPATYMYNWSPSGGSDTVASGLAAGTYMFTATDSVGCQSISTIVITQPKQLSDSAANARNIACFGTSTGRVTAGVTGGTTPYTYAWSTGATTANLTNVPAGSYTVIVTDANGCMDSIHTALTQPATAVADSTNVTTIMCNGGTANASVFVYGGVQPYTYTWSGGSTNTTGTATGLVAGTYVVTIRDSNRCRLRDTINITQPAPFITATNVTLGLTTCGNSASVQVVGTISKYSFSWSPGGGALDTAYNVCNGTYVVTVTDSTGCMMNDTIVIANPLSVPQYSNPQNIKVYPVPAKDQINVSITGNSFTPEYIGVYDVTGRLLITQKVTGNSSVYTVNVAKLTEGTYFMKLTGNGEKVVKFTVAGR